MRISLLTIWHGRNFGAELQTYATVRTLQEMGHETTVIDYRLCDESPSLFTPSGLANAMERVSPQNRMFEDFREQLPTTKHYISLEQLMEDPPQADVYLVGSDQVWNPEITRCRAKTYFLPFGGDDVVRASYASSIGGDKWNGDEDLTAYAQSHLRRFKAVSCREQSGCSELKRALGIDATEVLDPSLLRHDYAELTGEMNATGHLVYYALYDCPPLLKAANEVGRILGMEVQSANESTLLLGSIPWRRTPIAEWIRRIAGAGFVMTHSFHGMILSLLYHRPFAIIYTSKDGRQGRLLNLLESLGLTDRFFASAEDAVASRIWEKEIDFDEVDRRLDALRAKSVDFLSNVLK